MFDTTVHQITFSRQNGGSIIYGRSVLATGLFKNERRGSRMMSDNESTPGAAIPSERMLCQQAGFLPVPLSRTSYQWMGDLSIYLFKSNTYTLYCRRDLEFTQEDLNKLIDSGIDLVYVSVRDNQQYFKAIENDMWCFGCY